MSAWNDLKKALDRLDFEQIWRPVPGPDGRPMTGGTGHDIDGPGPELAGLDLDGKTVVDLGCNLGHYVHYAVARGASRATGLDYDARVVDTARLWASAMGMDNVQFRVCDLTADQDFEAHDLALMIDILGKINIRMGHMTGFLNALNKSAKHTILTTFRPYYYLNKDLRLTRDEFKAMYGDSHVSDTTFHLREYVRDTFADKGWDMEYLSEDLPGMAYKHHYLLTRRARG